MSGMREKNTLNQHCDETIHQTISSTNKVFAFSFSEPQWVTFREWGSRDGEQSERGRRLVWESSLQPESCCCWERERENSEVPPPGVLSAPATADRPIYETGGKCERRVRRRGGWTDEKDWRVPHALFRGCICCCCLGQDTLVKEIFNLNEAFPG